MLGTNNQACEGYHKFEPLVDFGNDFYTIDAKPFTIVTPLVPYLSLSKGFYFPCSSNVIWRSLTILRSDNALPEGVPVPCAVKSLHIQIDTSAEQYCGSLAPFTSNILIRPGLGVKREDRDMISL